LISLKDATVVYNNGVKGISGVTLDIAENEFVFIIGASGSGKSTLIRLLHRDVVTASGAASVGDTHLDRLKPSALPYFRRRVGVVFQDFKLLPQKTVYDNVAFAMVVTEAKRGDIKRSVPAVLAMVGLNKKMRAYPGELSGGEAQRCALARAIVNKPPVLLADEPTGNLDPETAWEIMKVLEDINARGTTVIVATHAKDIVDKMKKRVITLKRGRVLKDVKKGGYGDEAV